jgi:hypothetical protein
MDIQFDDKTALPSLDRQGLDLQVSRLKLLLSQRLAVARADALSIVRASPAYEFVLSLIGRRDGR